MAQPARRERVRQAAPIDPTAVARAYRLERAKRRARDLRLRERRLARLRFLLVVVLLTSAFLFLSLGVWNEIEKLFGL
jgi:type VI protein secretion system component VasF